MLGINKGLLLALLTLKSLNDFILYNAKINFASNLLENLLK